jgi:hypothetical protein
MGRVPCARDGCWSPDFGAEHNKRAKDSAAETAKVWRKELLRYLMSKRGVVEAMMWQMNLDQVNFYVTGHYDSPACAFVSQGRINTPEILII